MITEEDILDLIEVNDVVRIFNEVEEWQYNGL